VGLGPDHPTVLVVPPAFEIIETTPLLRLAGDIPRRVVEWPQIGAAMTILFVLTELAIIALYYALFFYDDGMRFQRIAIVPKTINALVCALGIALVPRQSVALVARSFDFWVVLWWYVIIVVVDVLVMCRAADEPAFDAMAIGVITIRIAADVAFGIMLIDHHPRFSSAQRTTITLSLAFSFAVYAVMLQLLLADVPNSKYQPRLSVQVFGSEHQVCLSTMAQSARLLMVVMLFKYAYRCGSMPDGHSRFATLQCRLREVPRPA
jgi:hypothetical protein